MRVIRGLEKARNVFSGPVVTIGNFDGVHLGHQVILSRVREDADHRGVAAVVLTFDPHPVAVLRPEAAPRLLMTLGDRLAALSRCGVDATIVQRFSKEFATLEAEEFVSRFLVGVLGAQKLVVGHDLNFGRGRRGTVESLVEAGGRYGFAVEVIRPVVVERIVVHSSLVRRTVASGDVALAARLLGRPHIVRGRVVHGSGRGKTLGFATANLRPKTPLIPAEGVYATRAVIDGTAVDGVTSIGHTPTFGGKETVVEAHLFMEPHDLYGKMMSIRFIERLREQRKFDSPKALAEQIARDVERARAVLAASSS